MLTTILKFRLNNVINLTDVIIDRWTFLTSPCIFSVNVLCTQVQKKCGTSRQRVQRENRCISALCMSHRLICDI